MLKGTTQVWIDVIDTQGNVAFSLKGPYGFGPFKPGIHPLDLVPYVVIAEGVLAVGSFYFRRRKKRDYLAPFDHFYALTSGALR